MNFKFVTLLGFVMLCLTACVASENVTVVEHTWEYTIVIEKFSPQQEQEDCNAMPDDAYTVSRAIEQRTRQVADGQTCRQECTNVDDGSGTITRSCRDVCESKYRTESYTVEVCDYQVNRWKFEREVRTEGIGLEVNAPSFTLAQADSEDFGQEKVTESHLVYILKFQREDGSLIQCELDDANTWQQYQDGQAVSIKFNRLGEPDCTTIKPQ